MLLDDRISVYFTDLNKENPWIILYHPTIDPSSVQYFWPSFANSPEKIYNSAEVYNVWYNKPQQKSRIISRNLLEKFGISQKEQDNYIDLINKWDIEKGTIRKVPSKDDRLQKEKTENLTKDTIDCTINTTNNVEAMLFQNSITVKSNWDSIIQISDYWQNDGDQIRINDQRYSSMNILNNQIIKIDIRTIRGNKLYITFLNEWQYPPNTIQLIIWWNIYKAGWKTWEVLQIIIE